jgi:hypothetical protein
MIILDGLRRDLVDAARTPMLARFSGRACRFAAHRSVFPSATRVVSATFATGCYPARHSLQGNSMALLEQGRLVPHDVGLPGFLAHKRAVTGCALAVPTLSERLAPFGGAVLFNNVSPGAAYAHDPDGFGTVHHRAGSFGPGRVPLPPLAVKLDAQGDRLMADRFIAEALHPGGPALSVLWCGEPDHIQHHAPFGSPLHMSVLAEADRTVSHVIKAVDRLRDAGDEVLLIVGSDHGHETISGVVDVETELVAAGLKQSLDSTDVLAPSNGTASLIYIDPALADRSAAVGEFLRSRNWAGTVVDAAGLASVGQAATGGLAFAVSFRADDAPNKYGIPGHSLVGKPRGGEAYPVGHGQHGGLGAYEQAPFLMIDGDGFTPGACCTRPSRIVDLAPSILHHLQIEASGMDGQPLQDLVQS